MFNQSLPIKGLARNLGQTVRTAINMAINCGQMFIVLNVSAFWNAQIAGIAVDNLIILPDELGCHNYIMYIGGGHFNRMNQSAACIHAGVALHAKAPFVALFCLMHFGAACFLRMFSGTGCINDGDAHHDTRLRASKNSLFRPFSSGICWNLHSIVSSGTFFVTKSARANLRMAFERVFSDLFHEGKLKRRHIEKIFSIKRWEKHFMNSETVRTETLMTVRKLKHTKSGKGRYAWGRNAPIHVIGDMVGRL